MYTIEDLLNSLRSDTNKNTNNLSPREVWDMIINKESLEKMQFSSNEELTRWIKDNPYENI